MIFLKKVRKSVPAIKVAMTQHWSLCSQQCCKMRAQSREDLNTEETVFNGKVVFPSIQLPGWWEGPGLCESQRPFPQAGSHSNLGVLGLGPHLQSPSQRREATFSQPICLPASSRKHIPNCCLNWINMPIGMQVKCKTHILTCFPLPWDVSLLAMLENLSSSILKV